MGRINSIQKGKRGEREVVKLLEMFTGEAFMRVPGSGAFQTTVGHRELIGDVMPVHDQKDWPFYIEVKNLKEIDLFGSIWKSPGQDKHHLANIWCKARRDAEKVGKLPVVWMRSLRSPWFCMTDRDGVNGKLLQSVATVQLSAGGDGIGAGETMVIFLPRFFLWKRPSRVVDEKASPDDNRGKVRE